MELTKEKAIAALVRTGKYTPEKAIAVVDAVFSIPLRRVEK